MLAHSLKITLIIAATFVACLYFHILVNLILTTIPFDIAAIISNDIE